MNDSTMEPIDEPAIDLLDLLLPLAQHWRLLVLGPMLVAALAAGLSFLITPQFTAKTVFIPPQQQQSGVSGALSQLGALAGLAGLAGGVKSSADQYVSLLKSTTVADRLIDRFKLMEVYDVEYRVKARKKLDKRSNIQLGKKDGLITVEFDDTDPQRAADVANAYIEELKRLTAGLALTEAQQRRVFFEGQLEQTRDRLTKAQQVLEASGFSAGAIRAEPKAAAEGYAKLKAQLTGAEIKLQAMRRGLAESTPEVQQQQAIVIALRAQLATLENSSDSSGGPEYISKYRDYKYQETLFEQLAKQYELARLDESKEGVVQIVDVAAKPERKSFPERGLTALISGLLSFVLLTGFVVTRHFWRQSAQVPETAEKLARLRASLGKA